MVKKCIACRRTVAEGAHFEPAERAYDGLKQMCGTHGEIDRLREVVKEGTGCVWEQQMRKEIDYPNKRDQRARDGVLRERARAQDVEEALQEKARIGGVEEQFEEPLRQEDDDRFLCSGPIHFSVGQERWVHESEVRLRYNEGTGVWEEVQEEHSAEGVSWDKSRGKWKAQIWRKKKNKSIGRFDTKGEAREAYLKMLEKLRDLDEEGGDED